MRAILAAALCVIASGISTAQTPPDKLALVVKNASRPDGLIIVEPMTPVLVGVTVYDGNRALATGDVLTCSLKGRSVEVTEKDGTKSKVSTLIFDCGKTKLEFKGLGIEQPWTGN